MNSFNRIGKKWFSPDGNVWVMLDQENGKTFRIYQRRAGAMFPICDSSRARTLEGALRRAQVIAGGAA